MNNKISVNQTFFLMFCIRICSLIMIPSFLTSGENISEIIIPMLIDLGVSALLLIPVFSYQKQSLKPGKVFSMLYYVFFVYIMMLHMIRFSGFISNMAGNSIHKEIIVFSVLAAAIYAAHLGLEGIVRFSFITVILFLTGAIIITISLMQIFLPTQLPQSSDNIDIGKTVLLFPELCNLTLLYIISDKTDGMYKRSALIWNCLSGIFLIFIMIMLSGSLGTYLGTISYPLYHLIDGSGGLQRMAPLFTGIVIALFYCMLSAEFWAEKELSEILTKKKSLQKLLFIISVILILAVTLIYKSSDTIYEILFNSRIAGICVFIFMLIPPFVDIIMKIRRRKKLIRNTAAISITLLIFTGCICMLSGCSAVQLDKKIIVQGIAIDKNPDGRYLLSVLVSERESEDKKTERIINSEAPDIAEAVYQLEQREGRMLLLSQCRFLLLNEEAGKNLDSTLLYFDNNKEIIKTTAIMATKEKACELLRYAVEKLSLTSEDIVMLTDSNAAFHNSLRFTLFDHIRLSSSETKDYLIPMIKSDKALTAIKHDGSIAVRNDCNESVILNLTETECIMIFCKEFNGYLSTEENNISCRINEEKTDINFNFDDNRVIIDIYLTIGIDKTEKTSQIKDIIKSAIESVIEKTLKNRGIDVLQLRDTLKEEYPHFENRKISETAELADYKCKIFLGNQQNS